MGFRIKTHFLIDFYAYHFKEHFLARELTGEVTHMFAILLVPLLNAVPILCFCQPRVPCAVLGLGSSLHEPNLKARE